MLKLLKVLSVVASAATVLVGGSAQAESQYGYSASGAGVRSANAQVNVTVNVPKLILLRVGTSGATVDTATLNGSLATGIPGGAANPLANGTNSSGWDGTAPVWTPASSSAVQAWVWTNAVGGGTLTGSGSGFTNILPSAVTVTASNPINGGLAHPGADLGVTGSTLFGRNTVYSSDWTFEMTAAALASAPAGSETRQMTYTATSF